MLKAAIAAAALDDRPPLAAVMARFGPALANTPEGPLLALLAGAQPRHGPLDRVLAELADEARELRASLKAAGTP